MFIDEKRSYFTSSELSEMLSISLNSEENKIGVRPSYKHFAATRLFSPQTPKRAAAQNFLYWKDKLRSRWPNGIP